MTEELERLRALSDEVREAILEADAQDCSSADCVADAVYEIVRVRLAATEKGAGLDGAALIAVERRRQIDGEGWTHDHDQMHAGTDDLALAAATYALPAAWREEVPGENPVPRTWPWVSRWWKPVPDDRIRELVKAGALIAAQIDLLAAALPPAASDEDDGETPVRMIPEAEGSTGA